MSVIVAVFLTVVIGLAVASMFEWWMHKNVMHKPLWILTYPYNAHDQTHHRIFKADDSYQLQNHPAEDIDADRKVIPMAWWNCLVIIPLGSAPFIAVAALFAYFDMWSIAVAISCTGICIAAGYYTVYEYVHWCMHLPKQRKLEQWRIFQWLDWHHRIHHLLHNRNLNVVLPFADLVLGTLHRATPTLVAARAFRTNNAADAAQ